MIHLRQKHLGLITGDGQCELTFERGFPTEETKRKVFDEIDYQRAVQAYL